MNSDLPTRWGSYILCEKRVVTYKFLFGIILLLAAFIQHISAQLKEKTVVLPANQKAWYAFPFANVWLSESVFVHGLSVEYYYYSLPLPQHGASSIK